MNCPESQGTQDLTGMRYGRLAVIGLSHRSARRQSHWSCICDCGRQIVVRKDSLTGGRSLSCGCLRGERVSAATSTHHLTGSPEWWAWVHMNQRCFNPRNRSYPRYGGRGITVCERWRGKEGFPAFLIDMGHRPSKSHSIDRINNDKGYCPQNCRWATIGEQNRNTRTNRKITFNGETLCAAEWAVRLGMVKRTLYNRLSRGWSVERAMMTPVKEKTCLS
jgi:hypothetical protein